VKSQTLTLAMTLNLTLSVGDRRNLIAVASSPKRQAKSEQVPRIPKPKNANAASERKQPNQTGTYIYVHVHPRLLRFLNLES